MFQILNKMFNFFRKNNIEGEWRTVAELEVGQMIIEVEGTHNFIGNNIFAHNTYITGTLGVGYDPASISGAAAAFNGNVGIGTTGPVSKLSVGGVGIADTAIYGSGVSYGGYFTASSYAGVYAYGVS